jgi:hypothetical protein
MFVTKLLLSLYRQTHTYTCLSLTLHSRIPEKSVYRMYTLQNNLKYDTKHVTRNT